MDKCKSLLRLLVHAGHDELHTTSLGRIHRPSSLSLHDADICNPIHGMSSFRRCPFLLARSLLLLLFFLCGLSTRPLENTHYFYERLPPRKQALYVLASLMPQSLLRE